MSGQANRCNASHHIPSGEYRYIEPRGVKSVDKPIDTLPPIIFLQVSRGTLNLGE